MFCSIDLLVSLLLVDIVDAWAVGCMQQRVTNMSMLFCLQMNYAYAVCSAQDLDLSVKQRDARNI